MQQFKMPQLGETVLEATVTRWLKRAGDKVEVDEPLVEVSTDKVDSEIPSPASGSVTKILVQEGETVLVGAVMAEIDGDPDRSANGSTPAYDEAESASKAPPASPAPTPAAQNPAPSAPPSSPAPAASPTAPRQTAVSDGYSESQQFRNVLSPLVRKLAAESGVDLETVTGTGTGGRITKQDVLDASAKGGSSPAPAPPDVRTQEPPQLSARVSEAAPSLQGSEEVVQVGAMRKAIAEHMVTSSNETARAWNTIEVDLTRVSVMRAQAGPAFKAREGFSLTWMPFVSKALTQALLQFPQLNSTWNGDGTITRKRYVNLGIAVALENGLIVPVVKGAETMNVVGLARAVRDVAERARNKKLTPDDVQGGTFTITNPGGFGSIMSVPIINRGQAAIMAFDAVVKRPVVVTDEEGRDSIAIRQMTNLSISWDHRIIDGAEAAKFLAYLKGLVEEADFASDLSGLLPG